MDENQQKSGLMADYALWSVTQLNYLNLTSVDFVGQHSSRKTQTDLGFSNWPAPNYPTTQSRNDKLKICLNQPVSSLVKSKAFAKDTLTLVREMVFSGHCFPVHMPIYKTIHNPLILSDTLRLIQHSHTYYILDKNFLL